VIYVKALEQGLLKLLSDKDVTFFIPPYQRNYEWDQEQCETFFKDIVKTTRSAGGGHFFGTLLYFQTETVFGQPAKLILVDGQQRLTTTMLFLVALRDIIDDENLKEFIYNRYLTNQNAADNTVYKIKLKQVETDWDAYANIILKNELTDDNKNSRVFKNYQYFFRELTRIKNDDQVELIDLVKGLERFNLVTIQLEPTEKPWENPQEIFESMNSIGKPLSLADLIRNYLLLNQDADEQERLYKAYWLPLEKTLPGRLDGFIRDLMQFEASRDFKKATIANHKELYYLFKNLFKDSKAEQLLKAFKDYSLLYEAITTPKTTRDKKIDDKLKDLRAMETTTSYSFLLGLLVNWQEDKFTSHELAECLEVLTIYILRRRIIGQASVENQLFPALVKQIPRLIESTNKKIEMFSILSEQENAGRLPNDIEVANQLTDLNFYNFKLAKFILALIEEKMTNSRPNLTPELQLEHIMPQTLSESWEGNLGKEAVDIHQEHLHKLGNLTLIRHNQKLGNKCFADKKKIYDNHAGLQIARFEIMNKEIWNRETILNRHEKLIDFILTEVLPIPEERRRKNNFKTKAARGLSFVDLGLVGQTIHYIKDHSITALVVSDKEVEFEEKKWKLSPLTREIETRKKTLTASGSYSGVNYWAFDGIRLDHIL